MPISEGSVGMKVMGLCLPMHSTKEMLGARIIHSQQTRVKIFLYVSTGLRWVRGGSNGRRDRLSNCRNYLFC